MRNEDDSELTDVEHRVIQNGREIYQLLSEWASSGARLVYSMGLHGFRAEGTVTQLRAPENDSWGIFKAVFAFSTKASGIGALIWIDAKMKLLQPGPTLELGENCNLHAIDEPKIAPATLERIVTQLKSWESRKAKVWAYLDFGFSSFGSLCEIEEDAANGTYTLSAESGKQIFIVIPTLSSRAAVVDVRGTPMIKLGENQVELNIFEPAAGLEHMMSRMVSKTVQ